MSASAEVKMQFLFALRSKGVTDPAVLMAMERVDRAAFVKGIFADRAYEDMPLPISCGQTISQPSIVGIMTQALRISPRDKILEVGTGSGYQAAILSHLARRVYTVDRYKRLVTEAQAIFAAQDITNITTFATDGSHGLRAGILQGHQHKEQNKYPRLHKHFSFCLLIQSQLDLIVRYTTQLIKFLKYPINQKTRAT